MGVADDFAAVAVVHSSFSDTIQMGHGAESTSPLSIAERAERPIETLSRWAGILAFCGALAVIAYFVL